MKAAAIVLAMGLMGTVPLHAQDAAARQQLDLPKPKLFVISKSLPAKGTLVMEVNVGEVRVVRSDEEKTIRLAIAPQLI